MAGPEPNESSKKAQAAREALDIIEEISVILNTHLTRKQLATCISLIENGVNPEALALYKICEDNIPKRLEDPNLIGD